MIVTFQKFDGRTKNYALWYRISHKWCKGYLVLRLDLNVAAEASSYLFRLLKEKERKQEGKKNLLYCSQPSRGWHHHRFRRIWWRKPLSICYNSLKRTAIHCNMLQHAATHCNTLQHTTTHYNTLQHTLSTCWFPICGCPWHVTRMNLFKHTATCAATHL